MSDRTSYLITFIVDGSNLERLAISIKNEFLDRTDVENHYNEKDVHDKIYSLLPKSWMQLYVIARVEVLDYIFVSKDK